MTLPHGAPTAFLLACLLVGVVAMLLAYRAKARGLYAASKAVASASFVAIAVLGGVPESLWGLPAYYVGQGLLALWLTSV